MRTENWKREIYSIVRCKCMLYKVESDLPCMNRIRTTALYASNWFSSCTLSWTSNRCLLIFPYAACFSYYPACFIYSDAACFSYFDVSCFNFFDVACFNHQIVHGSTEKEWSNFNVCYWYYRLIMCCTIEFQNFPIKNPFNTFL